MVLLLYSSMIPMVVDNGNNNNNNITMAKFIFGHEYNISIQYIIFLYRGVPRGWFWVFKPPSEK